MKYSPERFRKVLSSKTGVEFKSIVEGFDEDIYHWTLYSDLVNIQIDRGIWRGLEVYINLKSDTECLNTLNEYFPQCRISVAEESIIFKNNYQKDKFFSKMKELIFKKLLGE